MPNSVKICQSFAKILRFFDFSRWRLPPSWIFKSAKFYWLTVSGGPRLITVPNFVKLVVHCENIAIFRIFKMSAAAILDFWNREILLAIAMEKVETHQRAKFRQNQSIGCEDIKIFRFFKIAAVRHLGFVCGIFGPPTVSTWGSLSLSKIWLWSMQ